MRYGYFDDERRKYVISGPILPCPGSTISVATPILA